MLFHKCF